MLLALLLGASTAQAELREFAADGFWSSHTLTIDAPERVVYRALTKEVSRWWNPDHSYSGEARNFRLPAQAGACFCERLPSGGSVEHMRVVFVKPDKELRLRGGLGPLQELGVSGAMVFRLSAFADTKKQHAGAASKKKPSAGKTRLDYSYRVSGAAALQLDKLAEAVDAVQLDQLSRLKHWVEQRNPNWPALNQR